MERSEPEEPSAAVEPGEPVADLDIPKIRRLLRTLGARPSKSAEEVRERQIAAIRAMSPEERMLLALRLGRRDRAMRGNSG